MPISATVRATRAAVCLVIESRLQKLPAEHSGSISGAANVSVRFALESESRFALKARAWRSRLGLRAQVVYCGNSRIGGTMAARRFRIPHVFALLTILVFVVSLLTYVVPSGEYRRETRLVEGRERTLVVSGTYEAIPKHISLKGGVARGRGGRKELADRRARLLDPRFRAASSSRPTLSSSSSWSAVRSAFFIEPARSRRAFRSCSRSSVTRPR